METVRGTPPTRLVAGIQELTPRSREGDKSARKALHRLLVAENPIDVARVLHSLDAEEVTHCFDLLEHEARAVVLSEADPKEQALLLMHVGERGSADLLSTLDPDDAADVLESVEPSEREDILAGLGEEDAQAVRSLTAYAPETAGGLMTPLFVSVDETATATRCLEIIRENEDAETIHVVYVTDEGRLVGVFSIRDLLLAQPDDTAEEFMTPDIISVGPDVDQEEVIRLMETYHLPALPVVDALGALLGIVTADDALTALETEASEDVMTMAGAGSEASPTRLSVAARVRARLPWLIVTLFGGVLAASIIKGVEEAFGGGPAASAGSDLKNFLPLVAGIAGNVGMQSSAVMVRGFATGEIDRTRTQGVIRGEIMVAATVGVLCGLVAGVVSMASAGWVPQINLSIAVSIALASTLAGISGTLIPTLSDRLGIDPAVAAGPFITMLNDLLGFTIYMSVAMAPFWAS